MFKIPSEHEFSTDRVSAGASSDSSMVFVQAEIGLVSRAVGSQCGTITTYPEMTNGDIKNS
jgi:hypothetical protein